MYIAMLGLIGGLLFSQILPPILKIRAGDHSQSRWHPQKFICEKLQDDQTLKILYCKENFPIYSILLYISVYDFTMTSTMNIL